MKSGSFVEPVGGSVLTVNGGSSSIKFALYSWEDAPQKLLAGKIDRIGVAGTNLTVQLADGRRQEPIELSPAEPRSAAIYLVDWLEQQIDLGSVKGVGHRVVHGMEHDRSEHVTPGLLDELCKISPCDPEHLPREIELIEAFQKRHPQLPQVACFDTAFHRTMPRVARLLPIPRRFDVAGIQRYGFHGLSYAYLLEELARIAGQDAASGKVILAHLGNGASMAAVRGGKSLDTSMGFTPTGGLPMSTRTGDLDPGTAWYLMQNENLTPSQFNRLVNREAGLLGVSETSSDMRDLLERQATDVRAAEAVEMFCYQARKWIGAFAAVLGGLETLVFAGGIGENAPEVRARICSGLEFLGLEVCGTENAASAPLISKKSSWVSVRVIPTNEELMIAKILRRLL